MSKKIILWLGLCGVLSQILFAAPKNFKQYGRGQYSWKGIETWEARIFPDSTGGVARAELSLYNRGDDRERVGMDIAGVERFAAQIARGLNADEKELPKVEKRRNRNGNRFWRRWTKTCPAAELEWAESGDGVDYVRLTLTPKAEKAPVIQKAVSGRDAAAKVRQAVKKNAEGDVWIEGIPMVDQGRKGYCAAAVGERVLRYYGHDIDEHIFAQMAGSTAETGTSMGAMIETVKQVGSRYRLGWREIVAIGMSVDDLTEDLERYNKAAKAMKRPQLELKSFIVGNTLMAPAMTAAMEPEVLLRARTKDSRYRRFLDGVRASIDQGVPVFWGVTLGIYPEERLTPQTAGGHMRLIIGYNRRKNEIIFSDTWGSGHEFKRQSESNAFAITSIAFTLRPL